MPSSQAGRRSLWGAVLAALALVALAVPAGAEVSAEPDDKAVSLRALGDDNESWALRFGSHTTIGINGLNEAEVVMPPQTEPVVKDSQPGSFGVLDSVAGSYYSVINRAEGSLADGTAQASSHTEQLWLRVTDIVITADTLHGTSQVNCDGPLTPAQASEGSAIVDLKVDGERIPVGEPNEVHHRVDLPDGAGYIDVSPLVVEPQSDGTGWTTTALRVRVFTSPYGPVLGSSTSHELHLGIASTTVDCAPADPPVEAAPLTSRVIVE